MTALAAIRTHRWGPEEERLMATLRASFGPDVVVVFHNHLVPAELPLPVVNITDAWVRRWRLRAVPDWGWRCGDYFYYALRRARPGYDHYWLIEPDVLFRGDARGFFDRFREVDTDILGKDVRPFVAQIPFTRGLADVAHYRSIFCLTRFSGRALDRLFKRRIAYSKQKTIGPHLFTNDEIFMFSVGCEDPDLSVASMVEIAPDWFANGQLDTNPDLLLDALEALPPGNAIFHPVRGRESFKLAVAQRLAGNDGFLRAMRESLALLNNPDLEDIARSVAAMVRKSLLINRALAGIDSKPVSGAERDAVVPPVAMAAGLAPQSEPQPTRRARRRAE